MRSEVEAYLDMEMEALLPRTCRSPGALFRGWADHNEAFAFQQEEICLLALLEEDGPNMKSAGTNIVQPAREGRNGGGDGASERLRD